MYINHPATSGEAEVKLLCRRMKVAAALKNKEKQLEAAAKRPDPMLKEPQLRRDLDKLNATAHSLVTILTVALSAMSLVGMVCTLTLCRMCIRSAF